MAMICRNDFESCKGNSFDTLELEKWNSCISKMISNHLHLIIYIYLDIFFNFFWESGPKNDVQKSCFSESNCPPESCPKVVVIWNDNSRLLKNVRVGCFSIV